MKKNMTILIAASLIAAATAASAAVKEETAYISPVIGGITFDGKQHLQTNLLYGLRGGYNFTKRFAIEGLLDYANTKSTNGGGKTDMFRFGGDLIYNMFPDNQIVPYLAAGYSAIQFKSDGSKYKGAADYGIGAKYFVNDDFALRADVRHLIYSYGKTLHTLEYTLGLYLPFGGATPAAKPIVAPEPPKEVAMPKAAPAVQPAIVETPLDSDGDGVLDKDDKCPNTPAGVKVDAVGCPIDSDKDGVPDYLDKCPDTPAAVAVDATGCPLDSDKDGVPDYLDKCPGTHVGTKVDKDGCPEPVTAAVPKASASAAAQKAAERFCNQPSVLKINFDTNKADIKPKYEADLNVLGIFLKEYPNAKGEISGHTDNVGGKEMNQKLSKKRADSVKSYIMKKYQIAADRVKASGYGFAKPVASNKTAKGKAENRRIETNFTCE